MKTYGEGYVCFKNGDTKRCMKFDVLETEIILDSSRYENLILTARANDWSIGSSYLPEIEKVIYNSPATIVIWADGTKTIVKKQPGEYYDGEKGLAMCIAKKALGNTSKYYETFKKHDRDKTIKGCFNCVHKHLWASDLPCKGCFGFEHYEREDRK